MYIVFLKFGPHRALAGQWMAEHMQWLQQGMDEGVFGLAGSLDDKQGGALLAVHMERGMLEQRIAQDPFVRHGVVTADIIALAPTLVAPALAAWLDNSAPQAVSA